MNTITTPYIVLFLGLLALCVVLALIYVRQKKTTKLHNQFGVEYDRTVQTLGNENRARTELDERNRHINSLDIRPLTLNERDLYQAKWVDVQSKFVDEPGKAILDADRLIMEVMQLRAYPVADFDQRAADLSVKYPTVVSNYRSARIIALKNEQQEANTEELRQAMIYYRSLFEELLKLEVTTA